MTSLVPRPQKRSIQLYLGEAGVKVLAALIVNKVPAFGTAGSSTYDDVLHFVTVQSQATVASKLR